MTKTALVTGASGMLGEGIAISLAENGYDLGLNYYSDKEGAVRVQSKVEKVGRKGILLQANIQQIDEIDKMFTALFAEFGKIDLMINNAGITKFAPFLEATEEMWDAVNFTDWKGSFFCAQRAARNMVENNVKGVIINITSNHQEGCWPIASVYGPTKAALNKFTKNIALELSQYGIRVNSIAPGYTTNKDKREWNKEVYSRIPMGRFGSPEEVGAAVVYLASDNASYITGTCLTMDGGALLPVVAKNPYV